jgi:S-disulfanyl-L-cysteine oxidoreductase SoxD
MKAKFRVTTAAAIGLAALGASHTPLKAESAGRSVWDGVYTAEQAGRGRALYETHCTVCHGASLTGADVTPPLVGGRFLGNWNGQTVADLVTRTRTTMPLNDPGSLGSGTIADITAYIFQENKFPAGATELPRDAQSLEQIRMEANRPASD